MNRVLQHLGSRYPIIQSPMGWIARSQLASAVSNAGGFGMIETSSGEVEAVQGEIRAMRSLTDQPFGVNLPLMLLSDDAMVNYCVEHGVGFVTTSAGNPAKYIHRLKDAGITVYHSVATLKSALKSIEAGVDGLIVEGNEGGGFKNPDPVSTLVLLRAIRMHSDVPMVAAGGIADGFAMAAAFAAGAEAIQMGTRFVASAESPVHHNYKQAIVDAGDTDSWVVNEQSKPLVRALKTGYSAKVKAEGQMTGAGMADVKRVYFEGDMEACIALSGQSSATIDKVETAAAIIERIVDEFFIAQAAAAERSAHRRF